MTPLTIAVLALILGLIVGAVSVVGTPIFAIPIVIVALGIIGLMQMRRRSVEAGGMREFREQAQAEKVEFTERDRETTV